MAEKVAKATKFEGKKIKLSDKEEVTGTGKSKFYEEGVKYQVHPVLAETLKKAGKVK